MGGGIFKKHKIQFFEYVHVFFRFENCFELVPTNYFSYVLVPPKMSHFSRFLYLKWGELKGPSTTTFFISLGGNLRIFFLRIGLGSPGSSPSLSYSRCVSTISDVFVSPGSVFKIIKIVLISQSDVLPSQKNLKF